MKKGIIFVDSNRAVLDGLQQILSPLKEEWDMEFVSDPKEVLNRMSEKPFDAIVTELRLEGMNGLDLLEHIWKQYPSTIRLVLSDEPDMDTAVRTAAAAHQYLNKPRDSIALRSTLQRALALSSLLNNEPLKQLASRLDSLPSLPPVYLQVMDELQSPNTSLQKIGKLISEDIGMTAKML